MFPLVGIRASSMAVAAAFLGVILGWEGFVDSRSQGQDQGHPVHWLNRWATRHPEVQGGSPAHEDGSILA